MTRWFQAVMADIICGIPVLVPEYVTLIFLDVYPVSSNNYKLAHVTFC
jgi:hypothetical protein